MSIDLSENTWLKKLSAISKDDWKSYQLSQAEGHLDIFKLGWWHSKWYEWDDTKSDQEIFQPQMFEISDDKKINEIPAERKFGHPSSGRFACPISDEVSFWTDNIKIANIETQPNDITNKVDIPLCRYIDRKAILLDLLEPKCKLLNHLRQLEIISDETLFYKLLIDEDKSIYPVTHAIARKAFENGFDGILFKSTKLPNLKPEGIPVQFQCIALYKENLIYEPNYSEIAHGKPFN